MKGGNGSRKREMLLHGLRNGELEAFVTKETPRAAVDARP